MFFWGGKEGDEKVGTNNGSIGGTGSLKYSGFLLAECDSLID